MAHVKSLESWIWDAACSIRGAKDAPKYKDYILPLIFAKRLVGVTRAEQFATLLTPQRESCPFLSCYRCLY